MRSSTAAGDGHHSVWNGHLAHVLGGAGAMLARPDVTDAVRRCGDVVLIGSLALQSHGIRLRPAGDIDLVFPDATEAMVALAAARLAAGGTGRVTSYPGGVFTTELSLPHVPFPVEVDLIAPSDRCVPIETAKLVGRAAVGAAFLSASISDVFAMKIVALADRLVSGRPSARVDDYRNDVKGLWAWHRQELSAERVADVIDTYPSRRRDAAARLFNDVERL